MKGNLILAGREGMMRCEIRSFLRGYPEPRCRVIFFVSSHTSEEENMGAYTKAQFDQAYREVVLGNHFFEAADYYKEFKQRYFNTMRNVCELQQPHPLRLLEIGGGQIALLSQVLLHDEVVVADMGDEYSDAVTRFGIKFHKCDLLHDDLPYRDHFDLIVLCEVIEHLPIPPHIILRKLATWMKPGGRLLMTTPNLYRFRNLVRLATGGHLFSVFTFPEKGNGIGHLVEYSAYHFRWQIEAAGLSCDGVTFQQLTNGGMTLGAKIGRKLATPLQLRPLWRDWLVATATKPKQPSSEPSALAPALAAVLPAGIR